MSSPRFERLDLMETGTRYDHYMELRDVFTEGIEMLKQMSSMHKGVKEWEKQKTLEAAVRHIEGRIEYLADFQNQCYELGRTVDSIPKPTPTPQLLLSGATDGQADKPSTQENTQV